MKKICYILSLQILINIILAPSYKADASERYIKPVELTNKSSAIKKDKTKKNIKPAIGVTVAIGTLVCALFYNRKQNNNLPVDNMQNQLQHEPFLMPMNMNYNGQRFAYDANGMIEQHEQDLEYRYLFDDDFPEEINDYYFPPQNIANNHQINILIAGECTAREYDNVKRQFNGDKNIMELKNVVLYGSYFQTSPVFEYGNTTVRFQIFTTPSILLPGSEERECRIHNIRNSHRNIIFFDSEDLNIGLISQYIQLCKEIENPYIILSPIINRNYKALCLNNIRQIKNLFPDIKVCKNFIVKSDKYEQVKCGYFDQQSVDNVKHEILDLNLFF